MKINIEIKNLDELRKLKNLRYEDIEKEISRWTFHSIVSWKRTASKKSIQKLCDLFEVTETDIKWLLKN